MMTLMPPDESVFYDHDLPQVSRDYDVLPGTNGKVYTPGCGRVSRPYQYGYRTYTGGITNAVVYTRYLALFCKLMPSCRVAAIALKTGD